MVKYQTLNLNIGAPTSEYLCAGNIHFLDSACQLKIWETPCRANQDAISSD